jgi:hypothetical protein
MLLPPTSCRQVMLARRSVCSPRPAKSQPSSSAVRDEGLDPLSAQEQCQFFGLGATVREGQALFPTMQARDYMGSVRNASDVQWDR